MNKVSPYILIAGLSTACDRVEEVECSDLDKSFYAAQIEDLHDVNFQTELNRGLIQVNLENEIVAEDLADIGNELELGCATSIVTRPGDLALAATDTGKEIVYVDIDSSDYLNNSENYSEYLNENNPYAYLDGVGYQILVTAHEFTHNLLPDEHHSTETQDFIASISPDNDMTYCEGWTLVAEETYDLVYDIHAQVACAYYAFRPEKFEQL